MESQLSSQIQEQITSDIESNCNLVIGRKDTGKSTHLSSVIDVTQKKEIVLVSPKIKKYNIIEGEKKVLLMNEIMLFRSKLLEQEPEDMLLLFDDCRRYIYKNPNELNTRKFIYFLGNSRHSNNHIYFVYWSFSQITEQFFSLCDKIILFKTTDNITKYKDFFPDYNTVEKSFNSVNKHKDDHYKEIIEI